MRVLLENSKNYLQMNINNSYIIYAALLLFMVQSCSKMNDIHQEYLDQEEIVYGEKVDSVTFRPGRERVQLDMEVNSDIIENIRVYWNDYSDSLDVQIDNQRGTFEQIVDNLEERPYIFQLVSTDMFGNKSLPLEVEGRAYGDNFQSTVVHKIIDKVRATGIDDEFIIYWTSIIDGAGFSEIVYTDTNDDEVTFKAPLTDRTTILPDFGSGGTYTTAFLPDSLAIDAFYIGDYILFEDTNKNLIDNTNWSIIDYSTQHDGGSDNRVLNIIDGTQATRWHTRAGGSEYPHFVTIDLGTEINFSAAEIFRTTRTDEDGNGGDHRGPDKFRLEVSKDNQIWVDLGEFDFNRLINDGQIYPINLPDTMRYLRFTGTVGPESYMVLGEIQLLK